MIQIYKSTRKAHAKTEIIKKTVTTIDKKTEEKIDVEFTISISELSGPFHQNGPCSLTKITIEWNVATDEEYTLNIASGGEELSYLGSFHVNEILRNDFVVNSRWNKDLLEFTLTTKD
jgi:hypothetical protein